ncbi:MAG: branched-chain amino acid transport system permease protein [Acidimicrobiaceae bacterium]|jgi:branched-chain amino acid transport system permease protein|nr:branched-chain amino acid transport system permease protein [Acidimicrobiaceae bacterium]
MLALALGQPIVLGIVQGAAFGLMAIGLVLIYKSSRVFNFAAGEFATLGAFAYYLSKDKVPVPIAAVIGVVVGIVAGLLTERLVVRPLANRPKVTVLVATAATAITIIAVQFLAGATGKTFAVPALWKGTLPFRILGLYVSYQQLIVLLALALAGGALALFFSQTDLGLATLATSQEPTASRLMGIRVNRVAMLTWGLAGGLGGLAGVLLSPTLGNFTPAYGTTDLLTQSFTAAVLGGMTSVPGAFVGGLALGLVQNLAQFNISSDTLPGAQFVAVLVVLVVVLLVRPTGILGKEA